MLLTDADANSQSTPRGVIAVAVVFFALAGYLVVTAALIALGIVAFTAGAWLLGGLETMGPLIHIIAAIIAAIIGWGLLRLKNWARHLATIVAGVVFVLSIPIISGAVAYSQIPAIAREGLKVIVCVVLFRYLNTGQTATAFTRANLSRKKEG